MKYQIGDEILVLHSNEEGKVIEIINDEMVLIEVRGVKFPAYLDQIDFPYFKRFTQKKLFPEAKKKEFIDEIPREKKPVTNIKNNDGVWFSMVPKFYLDDFNDEVVESFKLYLVNHSDKDLHFIYKQIFENDKDFELINDVKAGKDFYLHDMEFEDLNDKPNFQFTFSLNRPEKKLKEAFDVQLKLKSKQVFNKVEELKEKNEPVIAYQLFEIYPEKDPEDYDSEKKGGGLDFSSLKSKGFNIKYSAETIREHLPSPRSVVDLHIEKLTNSWKGLTNFEILSMQLTEFEKWFDLAYQNHLPSFIIIHGVGKGKLKDEIHDLLKGKREVKNFINQYDPRFGYGATEIFFQY
ncbi:Smr/MutS family protein [Rhizosphaericola mali]|uniref:Smr/MutS family protein n=1 Tax=Rhizosphaericola mali TaxID=2545455 RepID=A0A5P2G0E5_9BACT|nr:Smr/MutS family protein [Rhizosphaericola mali]QES87302.1 Smr/MutS family protein [Rhizosphaericola mali]